MRFIEDPDAGRAGEFEQQIKRGWFLGSESFREFLEPHFMGHTQKDTYRGVQRKDHGEAEAERILQVCLTELGLTQEEVFAMKGTHPSKQVLAWVLKTQTIVTGSWIADRLQMGHRVNASRAIHHVRNSPDRSLQRLKKKMLQCTA